MIMGTKVIISAPSLDPSINVSGVSAVANFIIDNNRDVEYVHFEIGRKDNEKGGIRRVVSIVKAVRRWRKLLKQHPDAIVHYSFPLNTPSILRDPIFMWIAKRRNRKMVIHIHGGLYLTSDSIPFAIQKILNWVFDWNVPFVVLSDCEKDTLCHRFGVKNVTVLPNCVDLTDANMFHREYSTGPLRLGYLGRIAETKGMKYLLEACVELTKAGIPFCLDIAGKEERKDEFLPAFKNALGTHFFYSGVVSGKAKCEYLRSLDLLVFPSYFEGLPISLLECMSYGCVPITTPVGSIPQVVTDGENGIFIKLKDSASIVDAVRRMHENRLSMQNIGTKAKETIIKDYSPRKYIDELNAIYSHFQ